MVFPSAPKTWLLGPYSLLAIEEEVPALDRRRSRASELLYCRASGQREAVLVPLAGIPWFFRFAQNRKRKLNWMSRGVPTVPEITPALGLPIVWPGRSNCG